MRKLVCLAVIIVGALLCHTTTSLRLDSESTFEERIVGGSDAAVGQFPYQVSLRLHNGTYHFCGGSIIGIRFILTAAHCTQGGKLKTEDIEVVVGAHNRASGGTHYTLDKIVVHPKYNSLAGTNDIMVLVTAKDIKYTELIQPIGLPTKNLPVKGGVPAFLSGWGINTTDTNEDQSDKPDVLQWESTVTISRKECVKKAGDSGGAVYPNTVCTVNETGIGACNGDSGSPLTTQESPRELIGVTSWVLGKCGSGLPVIYVRVFKHLKFIQSVMGEQSH